MGTVQQRLSSDKGSFFFRVENTLYYGPKGYYILWEKCLITKQEFVEYVRSHKKEIVMGALGLVGTGLLVALGVNVSKSIKVNNSPVDLIGEIVSDSNWKERNLVEGFTTGKVNDLWNEGGTHGCAILNGLTIKDMGALGENLKLIGGITDDTQMSAVLDFDTLVEI